MLRSTSWTGRMGRSARLPLGPPPARYPADEDDRRVPQPLKPGSNEMGTRLPMQGIGGGIEPHVGRDGSSLQAFLGSRGGVPAVREPSKF